MRVCASQHDSVLSKGHVSFLHSDGVSFCHYPYVLPTLTVALCLPCRFDAFFNGPNVHRIFVCQYGPRSIRAPLTRKTVIAHTVHSTVFKCLPCVTVATRPRSFPDLFAMGSYLFIVGPAHITGKILRLHRSFVYRQFVLAYPE